VHGKERFVVLLVALVFAGIVACGGQSPSASPPASATSLQSASVGAAGLPSGERSLGNWPTGGSVLEPAYNDADGSLIYLSTPAKAPVHPNSHNVAPLYVIMYPTAASSIGTVNCQHQPADNCPDHGPGLAELAEQTVPTVYGGGVWGHDHLLAAPGSGGDFNVLWEPIAVLFNTAEAVAHITTLAQLRKAEAADEVTEIPIPPATFHCSVVAASVYDNGTPVPTAPPLP
jgi:hypothetical protein